MREEKARGLTLPDQREKVLGSGLQGLRRRKLGCVDSPAGRERSLASPSDGRGALSGVSPRVRRWGCIAAAGLAEAGEIGRAHV